MNSSPLSCATGFTVLENSKPLNEETEFLQHDNPFRSDVVDSTGAAAKNSTRLATITGCEGT